MLLTFNLCSARVEIFHRQLPARVTFKLFKALNTKEKPVTVGIVVNVVTIHRFKQFQGLPQRSAVLDEPHRFIWYGVPSGETVNV